MQHNYKRKHGFSIIEIMVVLVIISILGTIARGVYLNYTTRSKVTEALNILEEYKTNALGYRAKYGKFDAYSVMFPDGDTTGLVSGTPGGTSAVKNISGKYSQTASADTGTVSGSNYLLLGVGLINDAVIISGADHVYIAGVEDSNGVVTWSCGVSASKNNTVNSNYLPKTCAASLP